MIVPTGPWKLFPELCMNSALKQETSEETKSVSTNHYIERWKNASCIFITNFSLIFDFHLNGQWVPSCSTVSTDSAIHFVGRSEPWKTSGSLRNGTKIETMKKYFSHSTAARRWKQMTFWTILICSIEVLKSSLFVLPDPIWLRDYLCSFPFSASLNARSPSQSPNSFLPSGINFNYQQPQQQQFSLPQQTYQVRESSSMTSSKLHCFAFLSSFWLLQEHAGRRNHKSTQIQIFCVTRP